MSARFSAVALADDEGRQQLRLLIQGDEEELIADPVVAHRAA